MTDSTFDAGISSASGSVTDLSRSTEVAAELLFGRASQGYAEKWSAILRVLSSWQQSGLVNECAYLRASIYTQLNSEDPQAAIPTRVCPSPDGGIAFEWSRADMMRVIEILDSTRADYSEFDGDILIADEDLVWDDDAGTFKPARKNRTTFTNAA